MECKLMSEEEIIEENAPDVDIEIPQTIEAPNMALIGATEYSVEDYTMPAERTFREAWSSPPEGSEVIGIDMPKARDIWRDKIRLAREPELPKLDAEFMKALEAGDTSEQTSIAAQKQAWRDAPAHPDIEAATTPDELKTVQPISGVTIE
jgi:hypothetical protein